MNKLNPIEKVGARRSGSNGSCFAPALTGTAAAVSLLLGTGLLFANAAQAISVISPSIMAGVTAPLPGLILPGTALSPVNGKPVRHLWFADHVNGFCRIDPDLASPAPFSTAALTCQSIGGLPVPQGPAVYDPATNFIYIADTGAKSLGVVRLKYNPAAGAGQGAIDPLVAPLILGGVDSCGLGGAKGRATAVGLGPDGNLYVGQGRSGAITRVTSPGAPAPTCASFATIATNLDGRTDTGFAFIGNDLYGIGNSTIFKVTNAPACLPGGCAAPNVMAAALPIGRAPMAIVSDQVYPAINGKTLFISDTIAVTKITDPGGLAEAVVQDWATLPITSPLNLPPNPASLTADPVEPALYVADDYSLGASPVGNLYKITELTAPTPPSAPTSVIGTPGNTSVTLNWLAGAQGSAPITSYTVTVLDALGAPTVIPDITVSAIAPSTVVPTSTLITGLVNGTSYLFRVVANNSAGASVVAQSALVTPTPPPIADAPSQPTIVAGNGSLLVNWTAPGYTGTTPLTSYLVQCTTGATVISRTVPGTVTSLLISALTNGASYSCRVTAVNSGGNSLPSIAALGIPTVLGSSIDVSLTGAGPASANFNTNAVYTFNIANAATGFAIPQGQVTVNLPATGYSVVGSSVVWGAAPGTPCTIASPALAPTSYTCNVGAMAAGAAPVAVTATLANVTAQVAVGANATALDSTGAPLADINPINNSVAPITTTVVNPNPPIDLSVTGTGPASVASADAATQTFSVANAGTGAVGQAVLTVTVPATGYGTVAVTPTAGTCTPATPTTYTCNLGALAIAGSAAVNVAYTNVTAGVTASAVASGLTALGAPATDSNLANNTASATTTVAVTPPPPVLTTDLSLAETGPASVASAAAASYIFNVANAGTAAVPRAVLTINLPAAGFTTATATGATCTRLVNTFTCNLGALAAGAAAPAVTVALSNVTAGVTVGGSVAAQDALGAAIADSVAANNTRSVATTVTTPPPVGCVATNATMTLRGRLQNGSGAINTNNTLTWTATNSSRTTASNCLSFTYVLPANMRFQSAAVSTAGATAALAGASCTTPAVGTLGGTVTCRLTTAVAAGRAIDFRAVVQPTVSRVSLTNTGRITWTSTAATQPNVSSNVTFTSR